MGNINYDKMDKKQLLELLERGNKLLIEWTEAVITMGAELYIICPQHEIFKGTYFSKNTLLMILHKVRQMVNICKYHQVIYKQKDHADFVHDISTIEKIMKKHFGGKNGGKHATL